MYRHSEREQVVIAAPRAAGEAQRYAFLDGRRGSLDKPDSVVRCTLGALEVKVIDEKVVDEKGPAEKWQAWPQVAFTQSPTRFKSHGTELGGMLIEPVSAGAKPPLVVYVHGSEKSAALGTAYPLLLAAQGITVFVYDKRGTGSSEGDYTQDFDLLADDAVAASIESRRMAAGRYLRFGFAGFSQGGWVAPLAAKRSAADFVAVGFGLLLTPLEEDQEQVMSELRHSGRNEATLAQALQVTSATGAIMASHFTRGFEELAEVKRRYADKPWLSQIEGEFTGSILREDESTLRRIGAAMLDGPRVIWNYDAVGLAKSLHTPMLWILAGEDRDAPSDMTRERLLALRHAGKPIDVYVFPKTDHGILEYVEAADGSRQYTRVAEGYFRLLGDWIRGGSEPPYGRAQRLF